MELTAVWCPGCGSADVEPNAEGTALICCACGDTIHHDGPRRSDSGGGGECYQASETIGIVVNT